MPMRRDRYPDNWEEISFHVRNAAEWVCQRCGVRQGEPHPITGSRVILTVAHVGPNKHDKRDCSQLEALCQRCHIHEDIDEHIANARRTRTRKRMERAQVAGQTMFWHDTPLTTY